MLPVQGAQVPSLVRELRSHMLCSVAKKIKCFLHSVQTFMLIKEAELQVLVIYLGLRSL